MSIPVKLPSLGESVVEGTVSRWLVGEGEWVDVDQSICEVTTDKVDAEIPAPHAGVLDRILVAEGATVTVGAELATIDEDAAGAPQAEAVPVQLDRSRAAAVSRGDTPATPIARRLADEARIALSEVRGTGSLGRVTKSDVLSHRAEPEPEGRAEGEAPARVEAVPTAPLPALQLELEDGDRVVPMSPQRRLIAAHMVYSKHTSAHVGTVAEVDMGAVASLRKQHGAAFRERHGVSLTYLPFVAHAVGRALAEFPALNASVSDDAIVERRGIHLSLAVETEKGLMAPVVRDADRFSLSGLALAIDDLSARARTRRITPADLRGGTFTVTNPGRKGNLYGFAIINQPQVGILRMGELVKRPVVRSADGADAIVIRPLMHLALSYDHRAVDGSPANAFLFRVRELLEAGGFDL
jgi:2-oxoglutarate dehydrogenase E2 component (dihydrolipoamide succinyltransferase)